MRSTLSALTAVVAGEGEADVGALRDEAADCRTGPEQVLLMRVRHVLDVGATFVWR